MPEGGGGEGPCGSNRSEIFRPDREGGDARCAWCLRLGLAFRLLPSSGCVDWNGAARLLMCSFSCSSPVSCLVSVSCHLRPPFDRDQTSTQALYAYPGFWM